MKQCDSVLLEICTTDHKLVLMELKIFSLYRLDHQSRLRLIAIFNDCLIVHTIRNSCFNSSFELSINKMSSFI